MLEPLRVDDLAIGLKPLLFPLRHATNIFDDEFRRFNRRSLLAVCLTTLGIFGVWLAARATVQCGSIVDCGWDMIGWLMLAAVIATIPVDFICVAATVTVFGEMARSGDWDLLALTEQDEVAIVHARYTVALARVWRPLALVTNIRMAVVLCLLVWMAVLGFNVTLLLVIPIIIGFSSGFVLEPRWRIRALAAVGLAVSTRARQPATGVLTGMLIIFLVGALQAGIVALLYWTLLQDLSAVIFCPVAYVGVAVLLYYGYRQIGKIALTSAAKRMTCCADDLR